MHALSICKSFQLAATPLCTNRSNKMDVFNKRSSFNKTTVDNLLPPNLIPHWRLKIKPSHICLNLHQNHYKTKWIKLSKKKKSGLMLNQTDLRLVNWKDISKHFTVQNDKTELKSVSILNIGTNLEGNFDSFNLFDLVNCLFFAVKKRKRSR